MGTDTQGNPVTGIEYEPMGPAGARVAYFRDNRRWYEWAMTERTGA